MAAAAILNKLLIGTRTRLADQLAALLELRRERRFRADT